jgi:hypothetical protein
MNAVASALLNGAILSAFLAAAIWLCLRLAPRHFLNAATRHMVWWMVLGITIALPVFQLPVHRARPAKPVQVSLPAVETRQTIPRTSLAGDSSGAARTARGQAGSTNCNSAAQAFFPS